MPKNTKGGCGHRKGKNKPMHSSRKTDEIAKRSDLFEVYGLVTSALGNRRFMVKCQTHADPNQLVEMNCSMRRAAREQVRKGTYVLVQLAEYNLTQGIIIDSYKLPEIETLRLSCKWDFPDDIDDTGTTTAGAAPTVVDSEEDSKEEEEGEREKERESPVTNSEEGSDAETGTKTKRQPTRKDTVVKTIAELTMQSPADDFDIDTI